MLEPRFFTRASLDCAVAFQVEAGTTHEGRAVNISEGGMLADLPAEVPVGAVTTVHIALPARSLALSIDATIVRCDRKYPTAPNHSVGVQWRDLSDESADAIREFVARTDVMCWGDADSPIPRSVAVRYVPIIRRIAQSKAHHLPAHVSVEELIGSAFVAFVEFYARSHALPEADFDRAARVRIQGAILDELRGADPLTRRMRQRARVIASGRRELEGKFGRAATHEEVAAHVGLAQADYHRALSVIESSRTMSIDASPEEQIAAPMSLEPESAAQQAEALSSLRFALDSLPQRLRQVLELHYGEDLTMRAIGNILGVSEARISQLVSDAVRRLRAATDSGPTASAETPAPTSRRKAAKPEPKGSHS